MSADYQPSGSSRAQDVSAMASRSAEVTKQRSKKAAEIAKEQIEDAAVLARDAATSGAYIWPIQGQYYFLTHPTLIKPVLPAILSASLFTICVTIVLFIFTYIPTVAVLAFVSGPLAFFTAIPVIIGEGAAIGVVVSKIFWLGPAQENLFDEVLLRHGLTKLVSNGRELQSHQGHQGKRLGKLLTKPLDRFSKEAIIRWLVSIPLNAIPVVGPALWFLYNGAKSGPSYHARYFQLKSLGSRTERAHQDGDQTSYSEPNISTFNKDEFIKAHRGSYSAFGAVAMAIDVLVPGGAILFMLGDTVGAALWAVEMEKEAGQSKKSE